MLYEVKHCDAELVEKLYNVKPHDLNEALAILQTNDPDIQKSGWSYYIDFNETSRAPNPEDNTVNLLFEVYKDGFDPNYKSSSSDKMVTHPDHYQSNSGLEVIDVIAAFTDGLNGIQATDTGNVIKYICRWNKKNGLQDLEKAQWYLNHLIKNVKENNNEKN